MAGTELERWERGERAPDGYPRLGWMLLEYQVPTVIMAALTIEAPLGLVLLPPIAVLLLIAGRVGYGRERALARAPEPPSFARTLLRHQLCAGVPLQVFILLLAVGMASLRLFNQGPRFDWGDFWLMLAGGEAVYAACVVPPLWLLTARRAHGVHVARWALRQ